jgi:hypothetical protein
MTTDVPDPIFSPNRTKFPLESVSTDDRRPPAVTLSGISILEGMAQTDDDSSAVCSSTDELFRMLVVAVVVLNWRVVLRGAGDEAS